MSAPTFEKVAAIAEASDKTVDDLAVIAHRAAQSFHRLAALWKMQATPDATIQRLMRRIVRRHHIQLPNKAGLQESINRLSDAAWWRRALRKRFRFVEHVAIQSGAVHAKAGRYVSARAMNRAMRDRQRIAELLASLIAVNQMTGETLPLDELAEQSLSNPANRRRAMMARIKGIEQHAKGKSHEAMFLTITCPSRYHARHVSGQTNDRYDGSNPRQAQAALNNVWRRATRKLTHQGVEFFGLRVVEPHHDACPHWHVLAFVAPLQADTLIETVRAYALADAPDEPGAAEHRFKVERIDPAKGSAVGYVAKYVSKSIDGEGVDTDTETGDAGEDAAKRIVAWARLWGIRQFQFFGVPPITPTRELYRLDRLDVDSEGLNAAHRATKANDYCDWLRACEAYGLRFKATYTARCSTRYEGETVSRMHGLIASASDLEGQAQLITRFDEWRIESRKAEAEAAGAPLSPPWTRFNNCAPIDFKEFFEDSFDGLEGKKGERGRCGEKRSAPRRAPLPNAGRVDWRSNSAEHSDGFNFCKNTRHSAPQGGSHA